MSALLTPLATAVAEKLGKEFGDTTRQPRIKVFGDPERQALERALDRACAATETAHGRRLAALGIGAGFLENEGAEELARAIVPGATTSPTRLAERCVDASGGEPSDDARWDRVSSLRPVFRTLLDAVAAETRREVALHAVLGRADEPVTADPAAARLTSRLAGHLVAVRDDEARYRRWVADQHRYVRGAGQARLPLDEVYVGLRVERDSDPGDRARAWFEPERERLSRELAAGTLDHAAYEAALDRLHELIGRQLPAGDDPPAEFPVPVDEAVAAAPHLVVLGDPGAGKTTLLRHLALTRARSGQLLPVHVRLGAFAGREPAGLAGFLAGHLRSLGCRVRGLDDLLRRRLDEGRCLLLLDGLDEAGSAGERRDVVAALTAFLAAYGRQGNRFVVTSRAAGYPAAPLPEPFRVVRLQAMDDDTVAQLLDVHCREVERAEAPDRPDDTIRAAAAAEASAVLAALTAHPGVRRLAANPLLLTALVQIHRVSGRLPHRRAEAYAEVCGVLGRTWRGVPGVRSGELPDERMLTGWLTELAAWIHKHRPEGTVTRMELLEVLGPLRQAHSGQTWDPAVLEWPDPLGGEAGAGVLTFVDQAVRHTGLLVEHTPGRFGFAHPAFEEFYTARALAFRGTAAQRVGTIHQRLHDPRYAEPILLALGLIGADYAEQLDVVVADAIHPAARTSPYEELLGRDFLFLLRALADDVALETATIDAAVNRAIEEWLDRDAGRCRFAGYRAELSARLAALSGTRAAARLRHALGHRAKRDVVRAPVPFCQLAEVAAGHDRLPGAVVTALESLVDGGPAEAAQAAALRTLIAAGELSEPVLATAGWLATDAPGPATRIQALLALAAAGRLTEPAVAALVELTTDVHDARWIQHRWVRSLAEGGALTGPVIAALVRAASPATRDEAVRERAVQALAVGDALTGPAVDAAVELATNATSPQLRREAAWTMVTSASVTGPAVAALTRHATGTVDRAELIATAWALAGAGELTQPVVDVLTELATGPAEALPDRVRALEVLANADRLTDRTIHRTVEAARDAPAAAPGTPVEAAVTIGLPGGLSDAAVAGIVRVALDTAGIAPAAGKPLPAPAVTELTRLLNVPSLHPMVRATALQVLTAAGTLTGPARQAAVELAGTAPGQDQQVAAITALARGGTLPGPVLAVAVELAIRPKTMAVRSEAAAALARCGALAGPALGAAAAVVTGLYSPSDKLRFLRLLSRAEPTAEVDRAILSVLAHGDAAVRREAGRILVDLARRRPGDGSDVREFLVHACTAGSLARTVRDDIYATLRAHVAAVGEGGRDPYTLDASMLPWSR